MELEKEVRFLVDEAVWQKVKSNTQSFINIAHMIDITFGLYGMESVDKTGKVFRIRHKNDTTKIEIKSKVDGGWLEDSLNVDSVKKGIDFLTLAGLKPYLYIERDREVRTFGNLKIFLDDVDLLGKFIEVEYQDSNNAKEELKEFLNLCGIKNIPMPMYGDIIKSKYENDLNFKETFDKKLKILIV